MFRKRFPELVFFSIVALIALVAQSCPPSNTPSQPQSGPTCVDGASARTKDCNEFYVEHVTVYKGPASSSQPAFNGSGWNQLATNDALRTNSAGEAQVNLKACWSGRLYVFRKSSYELTVQNCDKAHYDEASNACLSSGASLAVGCGSAYSLNTGSAKVTILGTSYATIYLPERAVTMVIPVDGVVSVAPLPSLDSGIPDEPQPVETGAFYFTMPEPVFDVDGLPPRQALPLSELPRVVEALGVTDWAVDIRDRADEYGVLPPQWPPELGGTAPGAGPEPTEPPVVVSGLVVRAQGGVLEDTRVQESVYSSVDWADVAGTLGENAVTAYVGDEPRDALADLPYDPERSNALLEEAGVVSGFTITLLWPEEDLSLERAAGIAAEYMGGFGFEALMEGVPGSDLDAIVAASIPAGEAVLVFRR